MFSFHVVQLWQSKNWANCPYWIYTMSWCNDHTSPETSTGGHPLVTNSIHSLWVCTHLRGWVDHQQLELIDRGISMIWWTCGKSMLGHNVGQVIRLVWSRAHVFWLWTSNPYLIDVRGYVWITTARRNLNRYEMFPASNQGYTAAIPIKKQRVCIVISTPLLSSAIFSPFCGPTLTLSAGHTVGSQHPQRRRSCSKRRIDVC